MRAGTDRKYLLAVLLVVFAFNYVDRQALGLLLQDIKTDLSLSDTQLGFLSGIAFALFYSVMGIPVARWADRGNRIVIIAITTALWSLAVILCGFCESFLQLLAARIVVAVGEAGCMPTAQSLIADYFTREERPRAVSIYMLGGSLSVIVGYFLAGVLDQAYGWRNTFILIGLPGLALAAIALFTLREPRRHGLVEASAEREPPSEKAPSLFEVATTLWASRAFRNLLFAFSVMSFFGYGLGQWQPAFFIRAYGLQTKELGAWFAMIYGVIGMIGTYLGGELACRFAARDEAVQLKSMACIYVSFGIISAFVYMSPNHHVAFTLMAVGTLGTSAAVGPLFATIQSLVPARMRAISIATVYFLANLIGMGLGPLAVGAMSDGLRPWAGDESLRYALIAMCPGYFWGAWHLWRGSRTVKCDLRDLQSRQDARDRVASRDFATQQVSHT